MFLSLFLDEGALHNQELYIAQVHMTVKFMRSLSPDLGNQQVCRLKATVDIVHSNWSL